MVRLAKTTKILLGVAIGLGTATVGTAAYYFSSAPETAKITVPSFIGKTKSDVESWMTENSVSSDQCTFDYTYDEEKDQDVVLSQSIEADSVLGSEEVLEITLSNGPDPDKEFKMPDFTGKKQAEVEQWFEDHKFTAVSYAFESDDKVEKGVFLKASADAGTTMKRSDELTITFSSGSDSDEKTEVTVPDFSSYSRKNMQAWASQNGITLTIAAQASDTVASGGFLSQSVKAGTKVKSGSSITVTLSSGKAIKIVSYVGKTRSEAETWTSSQKLKSSVTLLYSSSDAGIVLSQSPDSGTAAEGTTVKFTVSAGKVNLQDYSGKTKSAFEAYLSSLNAENSSSAKISVSYQETESTSAAGTILSQSVSGLVAPGTSVTVQVAIGKKYSVTSQAGKSLDSFKSYLSSMGLNLGNVSYVYSDSYRSDVLVSNDTGSYESGASINCVVSKGSYSWDPGSLVNAGSSWSSLYSASADARKNGYTVTKSDVESSQYSEGQIVGCTVSGKSISCQVSIGSYVTIPDVTGKDHSDASSTLSSLGLSVTELEQSYYSDVTAGQVVGQSLSAGTKVRAGTAITITYSKGPEPVVTATIPTIYTALYDGMKGSEIVSSLTQTLNAAGFYNLNFVKIPTGSTTSINALKSVSPAPGSTINVKDQITIEYYSAD